MHTDGPVRGALVLLVAGLVGAGFYFVGGPQTGRIERRDEARLDDLLELREFVICVANSANGMLPVALVPDPTCNPDIPLVDPFTDAPYRYFKSSSIAYQLCADFERPDGLVGRYVTVWRYFNFQPSTGCLQEAYWQHSP